MKNYLNSTKRISNKVISNYALLYVRVSSKGQEKEGYSLDAQEKLGEDYARRNNLDIVKRWKVSESAWREEQTIFNQILEYAKKLGAPFPL
jgi:site-specific DNA recombinase